MTRTRYLPDWLATMARTVSMALRTPQLDEARVCIQKPRIRRWLSRSYPRTLEVGPGSDLIYSHLLDRYSGLHVGLCYDADESKAFGRGGFSPRAVAMCGDARHLPFATATFSQIVIVDVLEHILDDVGVLRELCRVLTPTGRILIGVPFDSEARESTPPGHESRTPAMRHVRFGYSVKSLEAKLTSTGLTLERCMRVINRRSKSVGRACDGVWRAHWPRFIAYPLWFFETVTGGDEPDGSELLAVARHWATRTATKATVSA